VRLCRVDFLISSVVCRRVSSSAVGALLRPARTASHHADDQRERKNTFQSTFETSILSACMLAAVCR